MLKNLDKIWCWQGWSIIKWPFGALLGVLTIYLIFQESLNINFGNQVDLKIKSYFKYIKQEFTEKNWYYFIFKPSEKTKNLTI